jgi:hypothetical protein
MGFYTFAQFRQAVDAPVGVHHFGREVAADVVDAKATEDLEGGVVRDVLGAEFGLALALLANGEFRCRNGRFPVLSAQCGVQL